MRSTCAYRSLTETPVTRRAVAAKGLAVLLSGVVVAGAVSARQPDADAPASDPSRSNVVWDSPSPDHSGSMPLGNGDVAANVWWEPSGDLVLYIAKSDSWDEHARLAKVGRVRIALEGVHASSFRQELVLARGVVECRMGERDGASSWRVWVDANHPTIHVEIDSAAPGAAIATSEPWRTARVALPKPEIGDPAFDHDAPNNLGYEVFIEPDEALPESTGLVGWLHHNRSSPGFTVTMQLQGLAGLGANDPLLGRSFGAVIASPGGGRAGEASVRSPAARAHRFDIHVRTEALSTPERWVDGVRAQAAAGDAIPIDARREAHEAWWREFWGRSWLVVRPSPGSGTLTPEQGVALTRGYALQRYMNACAGRGAYPIKFNGSLLTVPHAGAPGDADYRRWGAGYWWQNTRLPYAGMCVSGDFDMIQPLFRMYAGDVLNHARDRTRLYWNHPGAYLNECAYFWGAAFNESYGWVPRSGGTRETEFNLSRWHRWEFQGGIELCWMMLDYADHTMDEAFVRDTLVPFAREILTFYDVHYTDAEGGMIRIEPSQALETWWECVNPAPELAGLAAVCDRLLALPGHLAPADDRVLWARMRVRTPELPTREIDGVRVLAPAERFANKSNEEHPELYSVFPYRRVTVARGDLALGIETYRRRDNRANVGWHQDDIFAAYLGLADEAAAGVLHRASRSHEGSRFPAFWGPNYDWVPDQTHGGVLMRALQAMLVQTDQREVRLLPAWPQGWDAEFRLHAPGRTVVEGAVRSGELVGLRVTPDERLADILLPER